MLRILLTVTAALFLSQMAVQGQTLTVDSTAGGIPDPDAAWDYNLQHYTPGRCCGTLISPEHVICTSVTGRLVNAQESRSQARTSQVSYCTGTYCPQAFAQAAQPGKIDRRVADSIFAQCH